MYFRPNDLAENLPLNHQQGLMLWFVAEVTLLLQY